MKFLSILSVFCATTVVALPIIGVDTDADLAVRGALLARGAGAAPPTPKGPTPKAGSRVVAGVKAVGQTAYQTVKAAVGNRKNMPNDQGSRWQNIKGAATSTRANYNNNRNDQKQAKITKLRGKIDLLDASAARNQLKAAPGNAKNPTIA